MARAHFKAFDDLGKVFLPGCEVMYEGRLLISVRVELKSNVKSTLKAQVLQIDVGVNIRLECHCVNEVYLISSQNQCLLGHIKQISYIQSAQNQCLKAMLTSKAQDLRWPPFPPGASMRGVLFCRAHVRLYFASNS